MITHTLGLPRIGKHRELKFALERFWRKEIDATALAAVGHTLRQENWQRQAAAGLDWVTIGDFAWYDHVLEHSALLGVIPERFRWKGDPIDFTLLFQMARGSNACHGDIGTACEMTKWFDTNYHYLVPEFSSRTQFQLAYTALFDHVREASVAGYRAKPVLLGPLTYLWLGKNVESGFDRLALLPQLLLAYQQILLRLWSQGVSWVQLDEPILALDLPAAWQEAFQDAYPKLLGKGPKILLTTYFGGVEHHAKLISTLPVDGLHIDLCSAPLQLNCLHEHWPTDRIFSVGLVNGRNIWRTDLNNALAVLRWLHTERGDRLWLSSSCSLLHVPYDASQETHLTHDVHRWIAFGQEKLDELGLLKRALLCPNSSTATALDDAERALKNRASSAATHRASVQQRLKNLAVGEAFRDTPFIDRKQRQQKALGLPLLPTTTIGSFPQTEALRKQRKQWQQGDITDVAYTSFIQTYVDEAIKWQEDIGLDVLVHGEAERNDMVEYFAAHLEGFAITQNGWVQSYGSRCVKPAIIYGDVARTYDITVPWSAYAQARTSKWVKGMLTGPITLLQWSFVRDDQPRKDTCLQLALAIRDEVNALETAGIRIIQIDEPGLREGLPLRQKDQPDYIAWATRAFRISCAEVAPETQIHTHMCYAEFSKIIPAISALDADVITLETSRSDMSVLNAIKDQNYAHDIGPGIYDVHSPQIWSVGDMETRLLRALDKIPASQLWVNPDCGLKTRHWAEVKTALAHMVEATKRVRAKLASDNNTEEALTCMEVI
jgi:5-methyltetrahydropteroyltriglutamate--homocysteine methyltransferase